MTNNIASATEEELQQACLRLTGQKTLHQLQAHLKQIGVRQDTWQKLLDNLEHDSPGKPTAFCCVNEEILERERRAISICEKLGWELIGDSPIGSHEIRDRQGELVDNVFFAGGAYYVPVPVRGIIYSTGIENGYADPYSAALSLVDARQVMEASRQVDIDRLKKCLAQTIFIN